MSRSTHHASQTWHSANCTKISHQSKAFPHTCPGMFVSASLASAFSTSRLQHAPQGPKTGNDWAMGWTWLNKSSTVSHSVASIIRATHVWRIFSFLQCGHDLSNQCKKNLDLLRVFLEFKFRDVLFRSFDLTWLSCLLRKSVVYLFPTCSTVLSGSSCIPRRKGPAILRCLWIQIDILCAYHTIPYRTIPYHTEIHMCILKYAKFVHLPVRICSIFIVYLICVRYTYDIQAYFNISWITSHMLNVMLCESCVMHYRSGISKVRYHKHS